MNTHNKPIARILGIPAGAGEGFRGLIVGGALCWSGGKPRLEPPMELVAPDTPVSRMVLEDRG